MTLNSVASRNAASHPLRREPAARPTWSSAASRNAWSSPRVSGRRSGRPSYSAACTAVLPSWHTWTGRAPTRCSHSAAHPYLDLGRRPLPWPGPGKFPEPADQPDPALDQRAAQPPGLLLPPPPGQHLLEQRRPRRERGIPVCRDERQLAPPIPHPAPSSHTRYIIWLPSATESGATSWHLLQPAAGNACSAGVSRPCHAAQAGQAGSSSPYGFVITPSGECCIRCNSAYLT